MTKQRLKLVGGPLAVELDSGLCKLSLAPSSARISHGCFWWLNYILKQSLPLPYWPPSDLWVVAVSVFVQVVVSL